MVQGNGGKKEERSREKGKGKGIGKSLEQGNRIDAPLEQFDGLVVYNST